MKEARAALLTLLLLLALILFALALFPGRTPYDARDLAAYWPRIIWRLFTYQQLVAGILALFAGIAVIFAAVIQQNAQRRHAEEEHLRDQIGVASVLMAEVRALITACDEFDAKFSQNMSAFREARDATKIAIIPLPLSSEIYRAIMPELKKLPAELSTAIVNLYAAYDVYRIYLMQAFDFASPDIDAKFEGLKKNISGEFRTRCETANQTLKTFVRGSEARLQS